MVFYKSHKQEASSELDNKDKTSKAYNDSCGIAMLSILKRRIEWRGGGGGGVVQRTAAAEGIQIFVVLGRQRRFRGTSR